MDWRQCWPALWSRQGGRRQVREYEAAGPERARSGWLLLAALALAVVGGALPRASAGVLHVNPYWFQDTYRTSQWVRAQATSAVGIGGTMGLRLAPASLALALQPHGRVVLAATTGAVQAYVATPAGVRSLTGWHLTALGVRSVAWLHGCD